MQSPYDENSWQSPEYSFLQMLGRNIPLVIFFAVAIGGMLAVYYFFSPSQGSAEVVAAINSGNLTAAIEKIVPPKPIRQRMAQSPGPLRIGIISGHRGNDAGAVCEDGLTEAEVNYNVAERIVADLQARSIRVDLLDEFDDRLDGYVGTAVVSIHADSCDYVNDLATGFKIAGSSYTDSSTLTACVENAYREGTQMAYHANTITLDMTDYHAFRTIAPGTPAIIIEIGFMNLDREMLTTNAQLPADSITQGILCYLEASRGSILAASE